MGFLIFLVIVAFGALSIFMAWLDSPEQKGKRGEKRVSAILKKLPEEYIVLNDLVFTTSRGTTQVDHLVISKYGVFSIETKNYRGDIYGNDNKEEWKQIIRTDVRYKSNPFKVYTYVTKNTFYNPVKQARGHIYSINHILKRYPYLPVVPIVVFTGDAILSNVHTSINVIYKEKLQKLITSYRTTYLSDNDVLELKRVIELHNLRHVINNKTHIRNINNAKVLKDRQVAMGVCPKCGGFLCLRNGKYGKFYGCENYPKCKYTTPCE